MAQGQKFPDSISVRIGTERRQGLEELAVERSKPGDRVTITDLAQEAIGDLLEKG